MGVAMTTSVMTRVMSAFLCATECRTSCLWVAAVATFSRHYADTDKHEVMITINTAGDVTMSSGSGFATGAEQVRKPWNSIWRTVNVHLSLPERRSTALVNGI